jgi:hypothetical protein
MRRIKSLLLSFTIILALTCVFQPPAVRANDSDPQGTSDSRSRTSSPSPDIITWILIVIGLL